MELYLNNRLSYDELLKEHLDKRRKLMRASTSAMGDIQNQIEDMERKIGDLRIEILQYEKNHPEEFENESKKLSITKKQKLNDKIPKEIGRKKLRSKEITSKILEKMSGNPLIQSLEKKLSANMKYWSNRESSIPEMENDSYLFWWCYDHIQVYLNFSKDIFKIKPISLRHDTGTLLNKLKIRNEEVLLLVSEFPESQIFRQIQSFNNYIEHLEWDILSIKESSSNCLKIKSDLNSQVLQIVEKIRSLGETAINLLESGGYVYDINTIN